VQIAVLADTHISKRAQTLPPRAWKVIRESDAIIHAGDVLTRQFLDELAAVKPLFAVRGNNDIALPDLPETLEIELAGVAIAVVHDSGNKKARAARMRKRFPSARVVIFGHSHIPLSEEHDGMLLFNPGSPTDRRKQPKYSMGLLSLENGECRGEIITLERV
jgi:hypothetical protein